jgi:hypothetical protein
VLATEAVELGRDDGGRLAVGEGRELSIEPKGGRTLGVAEAASDGVDVDPRGKKLARRVVP